MTSSSPAGLRPHQFAITAQFLPHPFFIGSISLFRSANKALRKPDSLKCRSQNSPQNSTSKSAPEENSQQTPPPQKKTYNNHANKTPQNSIPEKTPFSASGNLEDNYELTSRAGMDLNLVDSLKRRSQNPQVRRTHSASTHPTRNRIVGRGSDFAETKSLTDLNIFGNGFVGSIMGVFGIPLEVVDLSQNQFQGQISQVHSNSNFNWSKLASGCADNELSPEIFHSGVTPGVTFEKPLLKIWRSC